MITAQSLVICRLNAAASPNGHSKHRAQTDQQASKEAHDPTLFHGFQSG